MAGHNWLQNWGAGYWMGWTCSCGAISLNSPKDKPAPAECLKKSAKPQPDFLLMSEGAMPERIGRDGR